MTLRLGTKEGLTTLEAAGATWHVKATSLEGHDIWTLAHRPDTAQVVFAGSYGRGLYRSLDGGSSWQKVGAGATLDYVRALAFAPDEPEHVLVGTEPANVYRSSDGGKTWLDLRIRSLPGAEDWFLPYSPRGGAVRSLTIHPQEPSRIYGGLEQGGVLISKNGGKSWSITADGVHPDVHSLCMHPDDPRFLMAATGGGVYRSLDGGKSWKYLLEGYTRAVLVHPQEPELVLACPAERVGHGGRVLVSHDGGMRWQEAAGGLETPMADMVEAFMPFPAGVFAVRSNGEVLKSSLTKLSWRPVAPEVTSARALDVI